jgi:hypothetical protein
MPRPSHSPVQPINIWWGVQITKLIITQFSLVCYHVLHFRPKTSSSRTYSPTPSAYLLPSTWKAKFHTYFTLQANLYFVHLVFYSGGAVGWGTALQAGRSRVHFPMVSPEYFIDIILQHALWPWCWLSLYSLPVCRADKITTFMSRLYWNMGASASWNPQGLSRNIMGLLYVQLLTTQ